MRTYSAAEFHDQFGRDECGKVARAAGTSLEYFMHYVYGIRRPRQERALQLQKASKGRLDPQKLVFGNLMLPTTTAKKTNGHKVARAKRSR